EKRGLRPLFSIRTLRSELHRQVHEDQPAKRVVGSGERIAVAENAGIRGAGANERRILVEQVVDAAAQAEGLVDIPQARDVELIPGGQLLIGGESSSDYAEERIRTRCLVLDLPHVP